MPDPTPLPFDPIEEARRHWREAWGAGPDRPMAAVTSVMRAQQILMARLNELLRPLELTFPRYEALMLLRFSSSGSLPLGKMGERLQVHRTSMTHMADRLEAQGLTERRPDESDRRTTLMKLTPEGRDVAERATEILNGEGFGFGSLSDDDLDDVFALLRRLRLDAGDFTPPPGGA